MFEANYDALAKLPPVNDVEPLKNEKGRGVAVINAYFYKARDNDACNEIAVGFATTKTDGDDEANAHWGHALKLPVGAELALYNAATGERRRGRKRHNRSRALHEAGQVAGYQHTPEMRPALYVTAPLGQDPG